MITLKIIITAILFAMLVGLCLPASKKADWWSIVAGMILAGFIGYIVWMVGV